MKNKVKQIVFCSVLFSILIYAACILKAETYIIDPTHSTFGFSVKHMMVGITRGVFTDVSGEMKFDENNLKDFSVEVTIKAKSIDTRLEARDKHLKNKDFFDVEKYPLIKFTADKIKKKGDNYIIFGDFTMKDVTKRISAPVVIRGPVKTSYGSVLIGLSGESVINRQDYNISWNSKMPDTGFAVSNEVAIFIDIEAQQKK